MKVFITKYALTAGIQEVDAEDCSSIAPEMISVGKYSHFHGEGREWHRTIELARLRAEAMREAKIVSLTKQIAKLEKMKF